MIYVPKSFTWNECYVINEIIETYDFPSDEFEFNIFDQAYFYENEIVEEESHEPNDLLEYFSIC